MQAQSSRSEVESRPFKTQDWPTTQLEVVAELLLLYGTTCKMEHQSGGIQIKKQCTHDEYIHLLVHTNSAKKKGDQLCTHLEGTRFEATWHLKQNWGEVQNNLEYLITERIVWEIFQAIGGTFKTGFLVNLDSGSDTHRRFLAEQLF